MAVLLSARSRQAPRSSVPVSLLPLQGQPLCPWSAPSNAPLHPSAWGALWDAQGDPRNTQNLWSLWKSREILATSSPRLERKPQSPSARSSMRWASKKLDISVSLGNWKYFPLRAGLVISTFNPNHKCITFFTKFLPEILKLLGHWFNTPNQGISRND